MSFLSEKDSNIEERIKKDFEGISFKLNQIKEMIKIFFKSKRK